MKFFYLQKKIFLLTVLVVSKIVFMKKQKYLRTKVLKNSNLYSETDCECCTLAYISNINTLIICQIWKLYLINDS